MAGVLCFAENGYCVDRTRRISHLGLNPDLENALSLLKEVHCCAVGMYGNFFVSGIKKNGVWIHEYQLSSYPELQAWIESKKNIFRNQRPAVFHCALALEGDYYINFSQSLQSCQLATSITREIKARTPNSGAYSGNPVHIALGVGYSYVLVGNKGDFCWDLKGMYGNLDTLLKNAEYGIRTITLSPFNGIYFYVLFTNGQEYSETGPNKWDLRRVAP